MGDTQTIPAISFGDDDYDEGVSGVDVGLLVLRLMLGVIMAGHGAQKLFGWFEGAGFDQTAQMLAQAGFPEERAMVWVLALSEVVGGVGLIVGFLTPLAGAAVLGVMINAVAFKWGYEWSGPISNGSPQGIELESLIAASAVALAFTGAGRISVDGAFPGLRQGRIGFGFVAVLLGVVGAAAVLFVRGR